MDISPVRVHRAIECVEIGMIRVSPGRVLQSVAYTGRGDLHESEPKGV